MAVGQPLRRVNPVRSRPVSGPAASSITLAVQRSREGFELRDLLHLRLKIMSVIAQVAFSCLTIVTHIMNLKGRLISDPAVALLLTIPTGILWLRKDISLASLRRCELLILAVIYVSVVGNSIHRINSLSYVPHLPQGFASALPAEPLAFIFPDGSFYSRFSFNNIANPIILTWSVVVTVYGVLVPNTWRRSAILLSAMVLSSVLCSAYAVYVFPVLRSYAGTLLFYTFFVVTIFAASSLYGAHKINALRTAVLTAKQVGQYSLKQSLGKGGMGEVFLAQHRMLRRPCAVKLIRPEQAGDAGSLLRFEREVQAMAKLTHPNTVEIYDYGRTEEGTFYYAMEYLPGLCAEELVRRHGPVPPGRAIHLLRQVCGALGEAHAVGLIHRDIKPANLLICERGRVFDVVKLLDFGLVQLIAGQELPEPKATGEGPAGDPPGEETASYDLKLTQAGHILGTPAYMSPEQARGGSAEPRSDIYSIGAVGYFLLSGQPPFMRSSVARMMKAHESETPPPLAERGAVDAELSAVILKCLEKDPDRRYQSVKELEHALGQCQSAASWDGEQAARWWEQEKPILPAEAGESAATPTSAGSLVATLDATRDGKNDQTSAARAGQRSGLAEV